MLALSQGCHVQVWSVSRGAWLDAIVQEVAGPSGCAAAAGYSVAPGSVKVDYASGGSKWVTPDQLDSVLRRSGALSSSTDGGDDRVLLGSPAPRPTCIGSELSLSCPNGHSIEKQKDGLQLHQLVIAQVNKRMCGVCKREISAKGARWKCMHKCAFDVCDGCYGKSCLAAVSGAIEKGDPVRAMLLLRVVPKGHCTAPGFTAIALRAAPEAIACTRWALDVRDVLEAASRANLDVLSPTFDRAWQAVVSRATAELGGGCESEAVALLSAIPVARRAALGEAYAHAATAAALAEPASEGVLLTCHTLGVAPLPPKAVARLGGELRQALYRNDEAAARETTSLAAKFNVDLSPCPLIDGLDTRALVLLLSSARATGCGRTRWAHATAAALRDALGGELTAVAAALEREGSSDDLVARALAAVSCAQLFSLDVHSLDSGGGGGAQAASRVFLAMGVLCMTAGHLGQALALARVALDCEPCAEKLLAEHPGEFQAEARQLLAEGAFQWLHAPGGDSEVVEDDWRPYPSAWAVEAEAGHRRWLADAGLRAGTPGADASTPRDVGDSTGLKHRRCLVGVDAAGQTLAWTCGRRYSVDFMLMTCLDHREGEGAAATDKKKGGVVAPLRRVQAGRQTHPHPGQPHPWDTKRVYIRDACDTLNNDFFFRAFTKAMADAGHTVEAPADEVFDFRFNQDFRKRAVAPPATRGGVMYQEPVGWKKFAVRVKGRYDEGNNTWLCLDGRNGEWAVAYHGTNYTCIPGILSSGLRAGARQVYKDGKDARTGEKIGAGVYCTPEIDAAKSYAPGVPFEGKKLRFVFQCRVRPEAIRRCHDEEIKRGACGTYWVINDPKDIRPYGVLVQMAQ